MSERPQPNPPFDSASNDLLSAHDEESAANRARTTRRVATADILLVGSIWLIVLAHLAAS